MTPEKKEAKRGGITRLQPGRPVVRETAVFERTTPIILELHPKYLKIRIKGQHGGSSVGYDVLLDIARKRGWMSS